MTANRNIYFYKLLVLPEQQRFHCPAPSAPTHNPPSSPAGPPSPSSPPHQHIPTHWHCNCQDRFSWWGTWSATLAGWPASHWPSLSPPPPTPVILTLLHNDKLGLTAEAVPWGVGASGAFMPAGNVQTVCIIFTHNKNTSGGVSTQCQFIHSNEVDTKLVQLVWSAGTFDPSSIRAPSVTNSQEKRQVYLYSIQMLTINNSHYSPILSVRSVSSNCVFLQFNNRW